MWGNLCGGNGMNVLPYPHPQLFKVFKHLIYVCHDVGCSLKGSTASTIALWDHFHTYITYDLSTVAHDVNAFAEKNDDAGLQLRINAMVE
jgi:hypothetical protein